MTFVINDEEAIRETMWGGDINMIPKVTRLVKHG
jgi:hypothetical protein